MSDIATAQRPNSAPALRPNCEACGAPVCACTQMPPTVWVLLLSEGVEEEEEEEEGLHTYAYIYGAAVDRAHRAMYECKH